MSNHKNWIENIGRVGALLLLVLGIGVGCGGMELDEELGELDQESIRATEQALQTYYLPFYKGYTSGLDGPEKATIWDAKLSFLGWGANRSCTLFSCGTVPAIYLRNIKTGQTRSGRAALFFQYKTIPATGKYTLQMPSSVLQVYGNTVTGIGSTELYVTMRADLDSYRELAYSRTKIASDSQLLSTKKKNFSRWLTLPTVTFYAYRGQKLRFYITGDFKTWAHANGRAEINITRLGIGTTTNADSMIRLIRH